MKTIAARPATRFNRRQMLARLGLFTAAATAAPSVLAKTPLPHCEHGGEQLMALADYQQALDALPREADCPVLRELHARYASRPIEPQDIPVTRAGRTANLAVWRTGRLGAPHVIAFVHGILADHRTWTYIAGALGEDHELWLLDLPGCGQSSGHPAELEADAFSPTGLAERVGLVLAKCLADRAAAGQPAPRLTLVAHSLGGMIALRLLGAPELRERFADLRRQVNGLVVFAPCDVAVNCLPPGFLPLLKLTPVKVGIGRALGVVDDQIRGLTRQRFFLPECATHEQAEHFCEAIAVPAHLRSAQAMVRQAVPWRLKENRPDWPAIERLATDYANVGAPCLIAWGEWDETLPASMGHRIRDLLPTARLVSLSGSGHSVIAEKPLECAHVIRMGMGTVRQGCFAELPTVARYGTAPYAGPLTLAGIPANA